MTDSNPKPRIALGADHAGYRTKEAIKQHLEKAGYEVDDLGTCSEQPVDYPDYGKLLAEKVARSEAPLGIGVCGTGIGMAIVANKVRGVRAAAAYDELTARLAREHNDANVLTLGGRVVSDAQAVQIVDVFLGAQFAGGRHARRVNKIAQVEAACDKQSGETPSA
jgi:ribose 5-phosphate isomerase B